MARICKDWQGLARIGKNGQELAKNGKNWQELAIFPIHHFPLPYKIYLERSSFYKMLFHPFFFAKKCTLHSTKTAVKSAPKCKNSRLEKAPILSDLKGSRSFSKCSWIRLFPYTSIWKSSVYQYRFFRYRLSQHDIWFYVFLLIGYPLCLNNQCELLCKIIRKLWILKWAFEKNKNKWIWIYDRHARSYKATDA